MKKTIAALMLLAASLAGCSYMTVKATFTYPAPPAAAK